MNVVLKTQPPSNTTKIAHSILAYDHVSEELNLELPIPLFLDTLALKVAMVPAEDKYGSSSYPLNERAVNTFGFLLGLENKIFILDYFLEPTAGFLRINNPKKLEALETMAEVTPRPRYKRTAKSRISERELVLPTLRLLSESESGWISTSNLIARLIELFEPSGQDAKILVGRRDTYFSQKVRNMISHRDQPSNFINRGLAVYENRGLQISPKGTSTIQNL